ncbi:hypothetical protein [Streptomyces tropicalis]|uniref:Secreted protein n=1 Tax=Streptomyces tropicalis TaxID=3034234 RepID=A0ABT6ADE0_9ACTN|nr:hypothetical protein [Streptomyces tropicalis]MDF3302667.1 hypothetical protein [Streptomyces tropicalis]
MMRSRFLPIAGAVLVLALISGLAYALRWPPFRAGGKVEAADVCTSLGDASRAAAALNVILPAAPSYAFDEGPTDLRSDTTDSSYETGCFVNGGGRQLLSTRVELLEYGTPGTWQRENVGQFAAASSLRAFDAGDRAIASDGVAAIYVPCTARGANRHLSVIVQLKRKGDVDRSALRRGLIALAKNAAAYAHGKARCELPGRLGG